MADTDLIKSNALDVTKFAGFGSAIAAMLSSVIAVVAKTHGWPVSVQVALIGFAAVALVVIGIVVATDMMVRAKVAINMAPKDANAPQPVLLAAWEKFEKTAPTLIDHALTRASAVGAASGGNGHGKLESQLPKFDRPTMQFVLQELIDHPKEAAENLAKVLR